LTSAYSTISVADVAHFMGMSEEDATNCMFWEPAS
jgi:COP9 signalosome complex subunit 8